MLRSLVVSQAKQAKNPFYFIKVNFSAKQIKLLSFSAHKLLLRDRGAGTHNEHELCR